MHRVLISAYACEPGRGSEGEIGWSIVRELAKKNEVWVITRSNNKAIHDAAFLRDGKPERLHIIYYDLPRWARWYKKGKRFFLVYYCLWQIGTIFEARSLLRSQDIDLAHHLTGGMDWMPSGMAFLDLPFLWGPVGSEETHSVILKYLPISVRIKEHFRKAVRCCCRELNPLVRYTGKRAKMILSHTPENLPARYRNKVVQSVQTGIHPSPRFAKMKLDFKRGETFTVVYAAELIHWKGATYAVDAFLRFAQHHKDSQLLVIGDGPLRKKLERMAKDSVIGDRVYFLGKLPMNDLIEKLALGDVFLYPTYHHGLANILLQAMLTGLPVVCLEGDAIGRAVGTEYGITIPVTQGKDFIEGLAAGLSALYQNDTMREKMAKNAQHAVLEKYGYETLGNEYVVTYNEIIGNH